MRAARNSREFAVRFALAAAMVLAPVAALADSSKRSKTSNTHYIEFRSRIAGSYTGHTYAMYGKLGPDGKFVSRKYVGLHPADDPDVNLLVAGHFVFVRAITEGVKDDKVDDYVTSRFRVDLNATEYSRIEKYIADLRRRTTSWHAALNNCNGFVGKIAEFMGYNVPGNAFTVPETYIDALRALNPRLRRHRAALGIRRPVSKTVARGGSIAKPTPDRKKEKTLVRVQDPFKTEN